MNEEQDFRELYALMKNNIDKNLPKAELIGGLVVATSQWGTITTTIKNWNDKVDKAIKNWIKQKI